MRNVLNTNGMILLRVQWMLETLNMERIYLIFFKEK